MFKGYKLGFQVFILSFQVDVKWLKVLIKV
jgi:hypothetical protein